MSLNRVMIIGNLGRDPELRAIGNDKTVANFSVACTERWKDKNGEKHEKTEWVNCVAWDRTAKVVGDYLKKGSQVYIEGKMQTRSFDDPKNPGTKRYVTEILVERLEMLGGTRGGSASNSNNGPGDEMEGAPAGITPANGDDNDLPF